MLLRHQLHNPAAVPPGKNCGTDLTEGWACLQKRLGSFGEKSFATARIQTPDRPVRSLVATPASVFRL